MSFSSASRVSLRQHKYIERAKKHGSRERKGVWGFFSFCTRPTTKIGKRKEKKKKKVCIGVRRGKRCGGQLRNYGHHRVACSNKQVIQKRKQSLALFMLLAVEIVIMEWRTRGDEESREEETA